MVEGLEVGRKLALKALLLLALLGVLLTDSAGLTLPDRALSDRSREAGLNDMTSQCTGVPANGVVSNTSMALLNGLGCKR